MKLKYQIVFWRDIPAQVKVRAGKQRYSRPLTSRFQVAIDEAAMIAGLTDTDMYLEMWRTSPWMEVEGEPQEMLETLTQQYEEGYPPERLLLMIDNNGREQ